MSNFTNEVQVTVLICTVCLRAKYVIHMYSTAEPDSSQVDMPVFPLGTFKSNFCCVCSKYASLHVYAKNGCPTFSVAKGSCYDVSRVSIMFCPRKSY